jgi:hypothetical protein
MRNRCGRRRFLVETGATAGLLAVACSKAAIVRAQDDAWGDLVGRVVYDGPAPDRKKLKVDKDVDCCGKFDIRDESLMVGSDRGLANVFVYARTRNLRVCPELEKNVAKRVVLDNRDCIFMPHCMTIWASRQEFHIINSDPVAQNVAFSPLGDPPANIVLGVGKDATYTFSRAQILPVAIACNYHPWESGFILPRDNPYSAVSGKDGTFRIAKLPVGNIEFQIWQERCGFLNTPDWPKGRFAMEIKPGVNDLGTIKLSPSYFELR